MKNDVNNKKRCRTGTAEEYEEKEDLSIKRPKLEDSSAGDAASALAIHTVNDDVRLELDEKNYDILKRSADNVIVFYDDVIKEVLRFIEPRSVDLYMIRSSCLQWQRIVMKHYEADDEWRGISNKSIVEHPNMMNLIEGDMRILPKHPNIKRFLYVTVESGTLENIKLVTDILKRDKILKRYLNHRHINTAAERGSICIVELLFSHGCVLDELLFSHGCVLDELVFSTAAEFGHLDLMKWLLENNCLWHEDVFTSAAEFGNLEIMKWMHENGCQFGGGTFDSAVKNGRLENVKWLKEIGCDWYEQRLFGTAAKHGHLEIMKWLKKNGCPWSVDTFYEAAKNGNLENMKWLFKHGCPFGEGTNNDKYAFAGAAKKGIIENAVWLNDNGCPTYNEDLFITAKFGHFDMFKYLITKYEYDGDRSLDCELFVEAIAGGNFECIKFLKEMGCASQSDEVFPAAAKLGNLEIMKWFYAGGCILNCKTFTAAATKGNFEIMEWLFENKCPWDKDTFASAAEHGNFEIIKWLFKNGCPFNGSAFTSAIKSCNVKILNWLLEIECPFNPYTFATACKRPVREVLIWLLENGCPLSSLEYDSD